MKIRIFLLFCMAALMISFASVAFGFEIAQDSFPVPPGGVVAQSVPVMPQEKPPEKLPEHPDLGWVYGANHQPASLLKIGPATISAYLDTNYSFQFSQPVDHTISPSLNTYRHNEFSVALAFLGVDVGGADSSLNSRYGGPTGRLYVQYGSWTELQIGSDLTTGRGLMLTQRAFMPLQQAAVGWYFPALNGVLVEYGILPSYLGLESFLSEENWNYTRSFISSIVPAYMVGARAKIGLTQTVTLDLWLVNGFNTLAKWRETPAGGYALSWVPSDRLAFIHTLYIGSEDPTDKDSLLAYSDNSAQVKYYKGGSNDMLRSASLALTFDVGYDYFMTKPSGYVLGGSLANRFEFPHSIFFAARIDILYDQSKALIALPPNSADTPDWLGGGIVGNIDYWPSPWLLLRLEYAHRLANQRYFSGPGGIAVAGRPSDLVGSDDRITLNATLRL